MRLALRSARRFVLRFFCLSYRPCVSSFRFAFHACPLAMAFDMGTVLLCSPLTLPCRLSRFVFLYSVSLLRLALRPVLRLVCASRPASRSASRYASRLASRFHCLSAGHDLTFVWAPFRPACRLPSRFASRVRRLRFCLVCRPCISSCRLVLYAVPRFLFCVSALRLAHCVSLLPLAHRRCFSFGTVPLCSPLVFVVSCRSVPDDLDEPDEKLDETQDETRSETRCEKRGRRRSRVHMRFPWAFNYIGAVSPCSSLIPFSVSSFPVPPCVSVSRIALRSVRAVSFRLVPCLVPHPRPFSSHRAFRTRSNREGSSRKGRGGGRRR